MEMRLDFCDKFTYHNGNRDKFSKDESFEKKNGVNPKIVLDKLEINLVHEYHNNDRIDKACSLREDY
jgi:hypothetical protein